MSEIQEKRKRISSLGGYTCLECGSKTDLVVDHIKPKAAGGTDCSDNLQILCRSCNARKSSMYNGKRYRYLALYYEPEQLELIDKYGLVVVRKGRQCIDCAVPDDVQTDADFVEDMAKLNKRYQERWNALLESVMNRVETDADFQRYIQECWKSNMLLLEENEAIYETR